MAINKATLAKEVDGTIEYIYPKTTADIVEYSSTQSVEEKLDELHNAIYAIDVEESLSDYYSKTEIDDMLYTPIVINSVSVSPSTAERGATVNVTVSWNISRTPNTLTVDGTTVSPTAAGSKSFSDVTGSSRTFVVAATDQGTSQSAPASVSKSATITFYYPIYWGAAANPSTINSTFINGLSGKANRSSAAGSFTVTASSSQYIWFACPDSNSPTFSVGGFSGGFTLATTLTHTNASGASTSYKVYKSQNAGLGATTVVVS